MYISDRLAGIRDALRHGEISRGGRRPNLKLDVAARLRKTVRSLIEVRLRGSDVRQSEQSCIVAGFFRLYPHLNLLAFRLPLVVEDSHSADSTEADVVNLVELYLADIIACRQYFGSVLMGVRVVEELFAYGPVSQMIAAIDRDQLKATVGVRKIVRLMLDQNISAPAQLLDPDPTADEKLTTVSVPALADHVANDQVSTEGEAALPPLSTDKPMVTVLQVGALASFLAHVSLLGRTDVGPGVVRLQDQPAISDSSCVNLVSHESSVEPLAALTPSAPVSDQLGTNALAGNCPEDAAGTPSLEQTEVSPIDVSALQAIIATSTCNLNGGRRSALKTTFAKCLATVYQEVVGRASVNNRVVLGGNTVNTDRVPLTAIPELIDVQIDARMKLLLNLSDMLTYAETIEIVRAFIVDVSSLDFARILKIFERAFFNPARALLQMVRELPSKPLVWLVKNQQREKSFFSHVVDHNEPVAVEGQDGVNVAKAQVLHFSKKTAAEAPKDERGSSHDGLDEDQEDAVEEPFEQIDDGVASVSEVAEVERAATMPMMPEETSNQCALDAYLRQLRSLPIIPHDELIALATKYQAMLSEVVTKYQATLAPADKNKTIPPQMLSLDVLNQIMTPEIIKIRNKIWVHNLRLVVGIARKYHWSTISLSDRIQEGNMGLAIAINRFDPTRGYHFSTYATWWIRQAVGRAVANFGRTVRQPVHVVEAINKYQKACAQLAHQYDRPPTDEEIVDCLTWSHLKLTKVRAAISAEVSTDEPLNDYSSKPGATRGDLLPSKHPAVDAIVADKQIAHRVRAALRLMSPLYRELIVRRYGIDRNPETLESLGEVFNITRERVRQLEKVAEASFLRIIKASDTSLPSVVTA